MLFRIINAVYKRLVLPIFVSNSVRQEQENEERLVLQNIPSTSISPLTEDEKKAVRQTYGKIWGANLNILKS